MKFAVCNGPDASCMVHSRMDPKICGKFREDPADFIALRNWTSNAYRLEDKIVTPRFGGTNFAVRRIVGEPGVRAL